MKDGVFSDDLAESINGQLGIVASATASGMRHSIRPRSRKPMVREIRTLPPEVEAQPAPTVPEPTPQPAPAAEAVAPVTEQPPVETPVVHSQLGWEDLHKVDPGARKGANSDIPVVDLARDTTSHRAFDLLRTRLRQTTQDNKWVNIGVSAPTKGCGTTFTAVNLALSLSRVATSRTVLMDLNLRNPGVMDAFDIKAPGEMQDYLTGSVGMTDHLMRVSETLALGLSGNPDENASETLQNPATAQTLQDMQKALAPELVIYDLPPMLVCDDVTAFVPQLDGVLLVSDGTQTTAEQLLECERLLDKQVPLLGVILNRARASSIPQYS